MVRPTRDMGPRSILAHGLGSTYSGQVAGLSWKDTVVAATTANITIATGLNVGDTIDGIVLVDDDRVLVKDQTDASENGIYVAGATPARAADMDQSNEILGTIVGVIGGTVGEGSVWRVTNTDPTTIDTDDIDWAEFGSSASTLTVEDGTTSVSPVDTIVFDGATVTDDTGGQVTVTGVAGNSPSTVTVGPFYINDIPGTATTQGLLQFMDTTTGVVQGSSSASEWRVIGSAGRIVGLVMNTDNSRTAGTATARVRVAGSGTAFNSGAVVLNASSTVRSSSFVAHVSGVPFSSGDAIGVEVVTSGYTPTTGNFTLWLVLSLDSFGGAGSSDWDTSVTKSADEGVTNSSTLQDDNELLFAMLASQLWEYRLSIAYTSDATGDFKWDLSSSAGANWLWLLRHLGENTSNAVTSANLRDTTQTTTDVSNGGASTSIIRTIIIEGTVWTDANSTINFRFAQGTTTSGQTATVKAGSLLQARRIG